MNVIKKDLIKILILVIVILGSFAVIYYFNQKNGILDQLAIKLFS